MPLRMWAAGLFILLTYNLGKRVLVLFPEFLSEQDKEKPTDCEFRMITRLFFCLDSSIFRLEPSSV
ncbi:hypothetical protein B1B05_04015 [Domibacillus enclensis]|uniref:Uncharacterized protein n=1 Tax=Domibacillus enclensis TaxID=1017273 RepID=A0ABX4EAP5_9BACI|nr:hypothetical protein B1B05_04015 [Domibacillus enclensis]